VTEISDIIDLRLSAEQSALFKDILAIQKNNKLHAIFAVVADSYVPEEGRGVIRLHCKLVRKTVAAKIAKLIREDVMESKNE
jgi:hypothetical protein